MRKLAIVILLVIAACKRQVAVTTAPSSQPSSAANPSAPGGANYRDALVKFLLAGKNQDVQAMANVWGTPKGPARTLMSAQDLEMRIIYMMRCLRHDSYTILTETPAVGDKRIFAVQLKYGPLTVVTDFTTTLGPESRYYVETLDLSKVNPICSAK